VRVLRGRHARRGEPCQVNFFFNKCHVNSLPAFGCSLVAMAWRHFHCGVNLQQRLSLATLASLAHENYVKHTSVYLVDYCT
jgi:hypothetical protein